jgi:hypothetical protein
MRAVFMALTLGLTPAGASQAADLRVLSAGPRDANEQSLNWRL